MYQSWCIHYTHTTACEVDCIQREIGPENVSRRSTLDLSDTLLLWQAARHKNGTLSPLEKAAVCTTMRQVAQAISYTHQQGIVHRDIKPENVLLQDNGNVALCDFGISKDIITYKYESTVVLSAVGTAAYCAPEAGTLCT